MEIKASAGNPNNIPERSQAPRLVALVTVVAAISSAGDLRSVGDRSDMTARRPVIDKAGTGAAAKDGSIPRIDDTTIRNSRHAEPMAYVKKPEYGHAGIAARNLIFTGLPPRAKAHKGSAITIDGTPVETQDMDVEQLAKSIMRKGMSR